MSIDKINDLAAHNKIIAEKLYAAAARVIDSGWYALGQEVKKFETAFSDYCGVCHAVGVGNGTDAIEIALRAVGVTAGDEVITVANAGFYASTAILAIGATPVYADINKSNFLLCINDVERCITSKTKAVIATHLFGQLVDMAPLLQLAKKYGIAIMEDCAQAHGAERDGKRAGSWGDVAAFSFFPTKNLGALGDGGAVITSSDKVATRVRSLRQYGWAAKYSVVDEGARNSRLDEIQAAFLSEKLPYLDQWNTQRRFIAKCYAEKITNPAIIKPVIEDESHVAHLYVVRCAARDLLKKYLQQQRIGCDIHYPELDYQQSIMVQNYSGVNLPVSEKMAAEILTLPCYPEMTFDEVDKIAACINSWTPL